MNPPENINRVIEPVLVIVDLTMGSRYVETVGMLILCSACTIIPRWYKNPAAFLHRWSDHSKPAKASMLCYPLW